MKKGSKILSIFIFLLAVLFVAGSTGITLIIHNCHHCGDFSVTSGLFLAPVAPQDHCCEEAVNHQVSHDLHSFENDCCHFKIEKLKLTTFNQVEQKSFQNSAEIPFTCYIPAFKSASQYLIIPFEIHNKHGGRSLITYNCQYLS